MCARGPCRVDAHCHTAVHTRTRVRAPLLQNLQIACVRSDRYLLAQHFWAPSRMVFSPPRLYYKSTCVFFPPTFFMVLFFMVKTLSFWNLFGREAGSRDSVPPEAFLPQMTSQSPYRDVRNTLSPCNLSSSKIPHVFPGLFLVLLSSTAGARCPSLLRGWWLSCRGGLPR